jgi:putative phosphoesterase
MARNIEVVSSPHPDGSLKVGVISDTHVPDRVDRLHPGLLDTLRQADVDIILHAGDICAPSVLASLEEIAPVYAVKGNRDVAFHRRLPLVRYLMLAGTPVALMHGHGGLARYLFDKVFFILDGYRLKRYLPLLTKTWPEAKVVVFGHTHFKENRWIGDQLIYNPGSSSLVHPPDRFPSIGLLHFRPEQRVEYETVILEGWTMKRWRWLPVSSAQSEPDRG